MVKNLVEGKFSGDIYIVNPREDWVQNIKSYSSVSDAPSAELAILVVPAKYCLEIVDVLANEKQTKGFIIISSGFGEGSEEGKRLEAQLVDKIEAVGGTLIGPNCIGVLNENYHGVFTSPSPQLYQRGCDLISSSGATAVFILEAGIQNGLRFSSVYSVGNSAQTGVEEILEYMDETFVEGVSSRVKLIYLESIRNSGKLIKHASSLIRKGCKIAGIKAGSTEAGSRAATSHTGAMMNSEMASRALFRKCGIVYCSSRDELITVASVFSYKSLKGKNIAIITHAGGSAVMLTDSLTKVGLEVPLLEGIDAIELSTFLHPGSSVQNPIDFLATGTAEQLGIIIDYCEHKFENIDAMIVVFGSPGLFDVANVYDVLRVKLDICKKPIYPVLPSVINARKEISSFLSKGYSNFPDEVLLGKALGVIYQTMTPSETSIPNDLQVPILYDLNLSSKDGKLIHKDCSKVLKEMGIVQAAHQEAYSLDEALKSAETIGFPLAMKVIGPDHKSDVQGVVLNVTSTAQLKQVFGRLFKIKHAKGVLIQRMHVGLELFIGAVKEQGLGHVVIFGLGGIFVEVFRDVKAALIPVREDEARLLIKKLRGYPLLKGIRGQAGIDEEVFVQQIVQVSKLLERHPEIAELDINPLIGTPEKIVAVDVRIRVENPSSPANNMTGLPDENIHREEGHLLQ